MEFFLLLNTEFSPWPSFSADEINAVKNVLLVKADRDVSYAAFISALDNSKKAFKLFYNELSIAQHSKDFGMLDDSLQLRLKTLHPVALAEDVLEN